MKRVELGNAVRARYRRLPEAARAVGASMILTMRLFQELPERHAQPDTAIVREWTRAGRFDPRERLANGTVLTMPFLPDTAEHRPRRGIELGPNCGRGAGGGPPPAAGL
jgi:hypothetical protein